MAKHPSVPIPAQSGERRIGVSVKTLASLFARQSLAKTVTKAPSAVSMVGFKAARASYGPTNFKFRYSYTYSGLRNI
jgi:hypothetical protein